MFSQSHVAPEHQNEILQDSRKWDKEQRLRYLKSHQAIGLFNRNKRRVPNTLEHKITDILDHLATVKPKWDNPGWFDSPSSDVRFRNLESVLSSTPVYPEVGEKFRQFRRAHDAALAATVLLSQANMMALGVFLDTHERYWPIYTKNWHQDGMPQRQVYLYELEMRNELATTVHGYCR